MKSTAGSLTGRYINPDFSIEKSAPSDSEGALVQIHSDLDCLARYPKFCPCTKRYNEKSGITSTSARKSLRDFLGRPLWGKFCNIPIAKFGIKELASGLLCLVYPFSCEVCEAKIGPDAQYKGLCNSCLCKIRLINQPIFLAYSNIKVIAACAYEGIMKECVHLFKYKASLNLAEPLANLMLDCFNMNIGGKNIDAIIPVPLHRQRLRERGFNQAHALAKRLAKYTGIELRANAVARTKPTKSQTGLSKTKRFTNLRGAFKITKGNLIKGRNILLIDDVFTTGSTIAECARPLLKAGAKSVKGLVLAKGI